MSTRGAQVGGGPTTASAWGEGSAPRRVVYGCTDIVNGDTFVKPPARAQWGGGRCLTEEATRGPNRRRQHGGRNQGEMARCRCMPSAWWARLFLCSFVPPKALRHRLDARPPTREHERARLGPNARRLPF